MAVHYEVCKTLVFGWVDGVADDAQDVESRQDGLGQLDVLTEGYCAVVAPANRVSGSDDSAASLQSRDDTSLGDGDSLLLHRFVDGCSVLVVHLVEFVDQASTLVSKHERTTFQSPFSRKRISPDTSSETDGRCTLTCGEHGTVSSVFDVFEHLRLCSTRITQE